MSAICATLPFLAALAYFKDRNEKSREVPSDLRRMDKRGERNLAFVGMAQFLATVRSDAVREEHLLGEDLADSPDPFSGRQMKQPRWNSWLRYGSQSGSY
jgi:hypothetical protein